MRLVLQLPPKLSQLCCGTADADRQSQALRAALTRAGRQCHDEAGVAVASQAVLQQMRQAAGPAASQPVDAE
jgi:hypothetical protein